MDKFITTKDGFKIKYSVYGNQHNPALFFVTGIGGNSAVWVEYVAALKENFFIITNDFRGFGMSERPKRVEDYNFENFREELCLILNDLSLEKVNFIGHCFGGSVALNFLKVYPAKVDRIILVATSNQNSYIANIALKTPGLKFALKQLSSVMPKHYKKCYQNFLEYKGTWDFQPARILNEAFYASFFSYCSTIFNYIIYSDRDLPVFEQPCLLIAGKYDLIYPPRQLHSLKKHFSNNQYIELNDNHVLPLNRTAELIKIIKTFLK